MASADLRAEASVLRSSGARNSPTDTRVAPGHQQKAADQLPLAVFLQFHPHPAADEALLLGGLVLRHPVQHQLMLGDGDALQLPGIGEIDAEGPPDDQHVEPGETGHRPGADGHEQAADHQVDGHHQDHHRQEALAGEAAVRRQRRLPGFAVACVHVPFYPSHMQGNTERMAKATRLKPDEVAEIFRRFHAANPEPKGELHYVNPYTLLVAVVLSAQATDEGVNRATKPLFAIADTPEKMVALGEDTVRDMIKTIGLFRGKAKNVIQLSQQLIDRHGGQVPDDREALEALPGVGRKTANVVLNIAFGHPDNRGRYAFVPAGKPHRTGPRQDALRGREQAAEGGAGSAMAAMPTTG